MRTIRSTESRAIAAKITAAMGAAFLVSAFAMAMVLRPLLSLGQLLNSLDHTTVLAWEKAQRSGVSLWLWVHVAMPLLVRPAWMLPTMLGVVLTGLAAQLAWGKRR